MTITPMSLTPVEVRHLELRRGLFGYRRAGVRHAMDDIADSFELVWRERADMSERIELLEGELARHAEVEALLRQTLVSAERAAQDLKEQARREADVIVAEANAESRRIVRDAITEKERLLGEARRVQAILRSALEIVEESAPGELTATTGPVAAEPPANAEPDEPPAQQLAG
ncbi:MAG: DivIVA domain-containing protein [Gaiellales bacterium]